MPETRAVSTFTLALVAMVLWGCAPLLEKAGLSRVSALTGVCVRSWVIAVGLVVVVAVTKGWGEIRAVDGRTLFLLGVGGIMAGLVGQVAYYAALKLGEASRVVPITAGFPLVAVLLGIVILREGFSVGKVAGAVLVVAGVMLLRLSR